MLKPGMFIADRYEIIDKVGSGGMADVYKARCHKLNRFVAVKVLKPEYSNDRNFVSKFRGEAQSAAGLSHPNIVGVFDVGEDEGLYYIVMELIEGITLKSFIERKGRLDFRESIGIAIQIAQGMEAAHANHIIHRDIKPQNIIISKEGKVKVADFGIAKATSSNTLTSNAMGSVHYISPEQARGGYSDEKSDIYSLGVTIYEMVSGIVPFEGDNAVSIALLHIQGEARTLGELIPGVPRSLDRIVQKCMQKKPEMRYLSAGELITDLKRAIMEPNGDFVVIRNGMNSNSPTIALSTEDLDAIRSGAAPMDYNDNGQQGMDMYNTNGGYPGDYNNGYPPNGNGGYPGGNPNGYPPNGNPNGNPNNRNNPNYGYDDQDDYEDDYYDDEPEEETVDPKVEKFAVGAAIGCAVIIGIILIVLVLKVMGFFGSDNKGGALTLTPAPSGEVATSAQPSALPDGEMIAIPQVIGRNKDSAKQLLESNNLVCVIKEIASPSEIGTVLTCTPNEGTQVAQGSQVTIEISAGTKTTKMPGVDNLSVDNAKKVLMAKFGNNINIKETNATSDTVKIGNVIKSDPASNSEVAEGLTEVTLYVSSGADVKYVNVPKVVGLKFEQAKDLLEKNNLRFSETYRENEDYDEGYVCKQQTTPGTKVEEGTSIGITISKGKTEVNYKYTVKIKVPSSYNPFSEPANPDETASPDAGAVNNGTISLDVKLNGKTIETSGVESSYDEFKANGLSYEFEFTDTNDEITDSNFGVVFKLNNQTLSDWNPRITVSAPKKVK